MRAPRRMQSDQRYHSDGSCTRPIRQPAGGRPGASRRTATARASSSYGNCGSESRGRSTPDCACSYAESDHILTLNLLAVLNDINRLADAALRSGSACGERLSRFQEPRRLRKLRAGDRGDSHCRGAAARWRPLGLLGMRCMASRRKERTSPMTSGATTCCTRRWPRPATCSIMREGCTLVLPGNDRTGQQVLSGRCASTQASTIRRSSRSARSARWSSSSAEQRRNLLKAVHAIPDTDWKSFEGKQMQRGAGSGASGAITASARSQGHVVQRQKDAEMPPGYIDPSFISDSSLEGYVIKKSLR